MNEIMKNYKNLEVIYEIGAGLGHTAYYNTKLNDKYYHIYDLPLCKYK